MNEARRFVRYGVYERASGRLLSVGQCRADRAQQQAMQSEYAIILGAVSDARQYVDDSGVLQARQALNINVSTDQIQADGVDAVVISGIPPGAICWIRGPVDRAPWVETGASIRLTANVVGTYLVTIDHCQYLVRSVQIEAVL